MSLLSLNLHSHPFNHSFTSSAAVSFRLCFVLSILQRKLLSWRKRKGKDCSSVETSLKIVGAISTNFLHQSHPKPLDSISRRGQEEARREIHLSERMKKRKQQKGWSMNRMVKMRVMMRMSPSMLLRSIFRRRNLSCVRNSIHPWLRCRRHSRKRKSDNH